MNKIMIVLVALGFMCTGCEISGQDRELRQELFFKCLECIPDGPEETVYNDWAEVVSECNRAASQMSF